MKQVASINIAEAIRNETGAPRLLPVYQVVLMRHGTRERVYPAHHCPVSAEAHWELLAMAFPDEIYEVVICYVWAN